MSQQDGTDDVVARLLSTTDAKVWAEEFCRIFAGQLVVNDETGGDLFIDEGTMIGWFANAIEVGRSAGLRKGRRG